ncbi:MAG: hypothetical protein JO356_06860 [Acidobacteria bacterium]|nr:hypothetical protein [Acidobacteriota bacterium]
MILLAALVLSGLAFYYVFHLPASLSPAPKKTRSAFLRERKEAVLENLRDLNFEFTAGKLPESDYLTMKASLEEEAAALLKEIADLDQAASGLSVAGKEAEI